MGDALSIWKGEEKRGKEATYSYGMDWNHPLTDTLSADVYYTNHGHFPGHHPDGAGVTLYANKDVIPNLTLSAGVGPWAYCDTDIPGGTKPVRDIHGLGATSGAAATWHAPYNLVFGVRANYYTAAHSFNDFEVVGTVGYEFGGHKSQSSSSVTSEGGDSSKNQISLLAGQSAINRPGDYRALATSLEYKRELGKHVDVTVAAIDEGNNHLAKRFGVMPEGWLRQNYLNDRLSLSVGAGVYAGLDRMKPQEGNGSERFIAPVVSASADYKLTNHLDARVTWHRPVTSYDHDADIVTAGIGYRF